MYLELPNGDNSLSNQLEKLDSVHLEHMQQMKCYFNGKIKHLEYELAQSRINFDQKEINELKTNQILEKRPQLNKSLVDILNKSQNGNLKYENFNEEVITELENQLNQMRKECLNETENMRVQ